jgi:hypothetical protein
MTEPILKSEKLTGFLAKKAEQRASAKHWNDERHRLARILSPQYLDVTVTRVDDVRKEAATRQGAVVPDVVDEAAQAALKAEVLRRTLAGEPLANPTSIEEQLRVANKQLTAVEDALEYLDGEIKTERAALAIAYSKQRKPEHDRLMVKVCASLLETHKAWGEVYALKRHLIDNDVGLIGLCLTMPDFLGAPNDPYSDCADFLRAAKKEGFINAVPNKLVLR